MKIEKYDGLIYGNGLTLNLFSQLKTFIDKDKHYLLNIDDFILKLIENELTYREKNRIFKVLFGKENRRSQSNFDSLLEKLKKYYEEWDGNIEYHMGSNLFLKED